MQRKVFIGVDLPNQVKKRLSQKIEQWKDLPVKWIGFDNLHLTLLFLGYVDEEMVPEICIQINNVCKKSSAFDVVLERITLGPEDAEQAKMFWLTGPPNEELKKLRENIEEIILGLRNEKNIFRPHITLGRIRKNKWEQLSAIPKVDEAFSVSVPVDSVQVFESVMENGKRKFISLENCPLS